MSPDAPVVRLTRILSVPPARVFEAWLDPDVLMQWFADPRVFDVSHAEVDARVGGHFRIWHVSHEGEEMGGADAEITELVADERIVWRFAFVGPERRDGPHWDSRLEVTLRDLGDGGTELTLVHSELDATVENVPGAGIDDIQTGWEATVERLVSVL